MNPRELALKIAEILDKKGAMDIAVLQVDHLTSITDYFVIATGRNVQAVHSLSEDLTDRLAEFCRAAARGCANRAGSCRITPASSCTCSIPRSARTITSSASGRTARIRWSSSRWTRRNDIGKAQGRRRYKR